MPTDPQNIIFVMLDAARTDTLKVYGGEGLENTDALARNGTVYKNAVASGTYTPTSHSSLFLNKRVMDYKPLRVKDIKKKTSLISMLDFIPDRNEPTLARKMEYMLSYNTAMISNNPFLSRETGIAQGFGQVDNIFIDNQLVNVNLFIKAVITMAESERIKTHLLLAAYRMLKLLPSKQREIVYLKARKYMSMRMSKHLEDFSMDKGASEVNALAKEFAEKNNEKNNFLFVNYMEGHEGYPVKDADVIQDKWLYMSGIKPVEHMKALRSAYIARLRYADKRFAELMKTLRKKGILEDSLVIISSDHGQAFMEHGQMYHTVFPYKEVTDVPLITARFQNGKQVSEKKIIENRVSLTALHDAIINYAKSGDFNIKPGRFIFSDHTGHIDLYDLKLLKSLKNDSAYAKSIYKTKLLFNQFASAVYYGDYKLMHFCGNKRDELYNVSKDRYETSNIIKENPLIYNKMLKMA